MTPPVPVVTDPGTSVHVGSVSEFLYCKAYVTPLTLETVTENSDGVTLMEAAFSVTSISPLSLQQV
jgi:hypothetical protein